MIYLVPDATKVRLVCAPVCLCICQNRNVVTKSHPEKIMNYFHKTFKIRMACSQINRSAKVIKIFDGKFGLGCPYMMEKPNKLSVTRFRSLKCGFGRDPTRDD